MSFRPTIPIFYSHRWLFLIFCTGLFFMFLNDSILSYSYPILSERILGSNTLMGLALSTSSIAGVICDLLFPVIFRNRGWRMFYLMTLPMMILFAFFIDIGFMMKIPLFFLFGSWIWGIYYESLLFSQQDFVMDEEKKTEYSRDWAIILAIWQVALVISPLLAEMLINAKQLLTPVISGFSIFSAVVILPVMLMQNRLAKSQMAQEVKENLGFKIIKELGIWNILLTRVGYILILSFTLIIHQALFQVIGSLYGEELFPGSNASALLVMAYNGSLVIGMSIPIWFSVRQFKKRYAMMALIIGGLILSAIHFFAHSPWVVVGVVSISSLFFAFAWPFVEAIYSDLLNRLGYNQIHLLGLKQMAGSTAFIIGPTLLGFMSDYFGYARTFSIIGLFVAVVVAILFLLMPRKIKLPQTQLAE